MNIEEFENNYMIQCKKKTIDFRFYQDEFSKVIPSLDILRFFNLKVKIDNRSTLKHFKDLCVTLLQRELVNNKTNRTVTDPFDTANK